MGRSRLQRCFAHLFEQAPPLATHIVRSRRDLAKACLQVVHSGVLASSDPPVSPRPIKGHTCAEDLGHWRLQPFCGSPGLPRRFSGRASVQATLILRFRHAQLRATLAPRISGTGVYSGVLRLGTFNRGARHPFRPFQSFNLLFSQPCVPILLPIRKSIPHRTT